MIKLHVPEYIFSVSVTILAKIWQIALNSPIFSLPKFSHIAMVCIEYKLLFPSILQNISDSKSIYRILIINTTLLITMNGYQ